MYRKLASAFIVTSAFYAKFAMALGLGSMTMHSALNEPLDAEINLTSVGDYDQTQILVSLASNEEFLKAGIERTFFLSNLKFQVVLDGEGGGVVKITSSKRLNEPFLDLLIQAKWPTGRMLRSYTALVDLPVYSESGSAQVSLGEPDPVKPVTVAEKQPLPEPVKESLDDSVNVEVEREPLDTTDDVEDAAEEVEELAEEPSSATPQYVAPEPVKPVDVVKPKLVSTPEEPAAEPAAEPARYQEPASAPSRQDYDSDIYQIKRKDTLWGIASKVRPADASVQQTMLAIQRLNEHAFMSGNINRMKAGEVLRVPSAEAIREISSRAAIEEVAEQNREWQGAQLSASASKPDLPRQAVSDDEGHLRLTSSGSGQASGLDEKGELLGQLRQQLNEARENLDVAKLENQDLDGQVSSLSDQVKKLERLVELKNAELADLQRKLAEEGLEVAEDKAVDKKPVEQEVTTKPEEEKPADKPAEPVEKSEDQAPVEEPPKVVSKPEEKPEKKAPPAKAEPKPVEEPGLLQQILDKPIYIGAVGLLIVMAVVLFLLRRKTQSEKQALTDAESFDFDDVDTGDSESFEDEFSADDTGEFDQLADEDETEFSMDEEGDIDTGFGDDDFETDEEPEAAVESETGDAVGEADIYIAYGRYDQAAELLENALKASPGDIAIRSKLLEVYAGSGNRDAFREQFVALQASGETAAITEAKDLLSSVDGGADWLDDLPEADMQQDDTDIAGFGDDSAEPEQGDDELDLGDDLDLDLDDDLDLGDDLEADLDVDDILESGAESTDQDELEEDSEEISSLDEDVGETDLEDQDDGVPEFDLSDELGDDFDLSGDLDTDLDTEPAENELTEADDTPEEEIELDVSLDLDEDLSLEQDTDLEEPASEASEESTEDDDLSLDLDDTDLSFDLDEASTELDTPEPAEELSEAEDSLDLSDVDLETDLGEADEAELEIETPDEEGSDDGMDLDLGDLDEDFQEPEAEAPDTDETESTELEDIDLEIPEEEVAEDQDVHSSEETISREAIQVEQENREAAEAKEAAESAQVQAEADLDLTVDEPSESAPLSTLEGEDLEFLSDADEVATKLDLAQAYIDMGDVDGARDILNEVLSEGNDEQKSEAQNLIDTLD